MIRIVKQETLEMKLLVITIAIFGLTVADPRNIYPSGTFIPSPAYFGNYLFETTMESLVFLSFGFLCFVALVVKKFTNHGGNCAISAAVN